MSRVSTPTKLPLATWARLMGLHPLHFEQVRLTGDEETVSCSHIYFQHEWQTADHVSREEIATAIAEAEQNIEKALGYRLAPSWEVDEWQPTVRPFRPELHNLYSSDIRGRRQVVNANWGYFISGGIQAKTVIQAAKPIVYSDQDGDGYKERARVIQITDVLDPCEIAVFYPGKSGDDTWEIKPISVSIAGGSATIDFRRELAVTEELQEAFDIEGGEAIGSDDTDFLTTVDIYRRYNDPQTQASFLWEPQSTGFCGNCGGSGCYVCSYTTQTGCLVARGDPRNSIVGYYPGAWNGDNNNFDTDAWALARTPDTIRLFYYCGWRDKRMPCVNKLDPKWERVIAYYAAALLDRPPCDCSADVWLRHRQDLTIYQGDEDGKPFFRDPSGILDNPFGSRRGMVNAWRQVQQNDPVAHAVRL